MQRDTVIWPRRVVILVHRPLVGVGRGLAVGLDLAEGEGAQGVPGEGVLAGGGHHEVAVRLRAGVGPVQVAFGLDGHGRGV